MRMWNLRRQPYVLQVQESIVTIWGTSSLQVRRICTTGEFRAQSGRMKVKNGKSGENEQVRASQANMEELSSGD